MPPSKAKASIRMSGLRVSGRLFRIEQVFDEEPDPRRVPLYRKFAADRVNISFLYADGLEPAKRICCLVEREIVSRFGDVPVRSFKLPAHPQGPEAALVSVFPHSFDPVAVGAALGAFGMEDLAWHYMATSGSMVSFVIDYERRENAVAALENHIDFPEAHGPLCPGMEYDPIARSLKIAPETVARYVEPKIRTYGINVQTGLKLFSLQMQADAFEQWSRVASERGFRFWFASAFNTSDIDGIALEMLLKPPDIERNEADIESLVVNDLAGSTEFREKAEMVSFHGPHFGDRYGIADKAIGSLKSAGVSVWLAGCVGATVTAVIPPDMSDKAVKALSEAFEIP